MTHGATTSKHWTKRFAGVLLVRNQRREQCVFCVDRAFACGMDVLSVVCRHGTFSAERIWQPTPRGIGGEGAGRLQCRVAAVLQHHKNRARECRRYHWSFMFMAFFQLVRCLRLLDCYPGKGTSITTPRETLGSVYFLSISVKDAGWNFYIEEGRKENKAEPFRREEDPLSGRKPRLLAQRRTEPAAWRGGLYRLVRLWGRDVYLLMLRGKRSQGEGGPSRHIHEAGIATVCQ
jgi:hypothetical protein